MVRFRFSRTITHDYVTDNYGESKPLTAESVNARELNSKREKRSVRYVPMSGGLAISFHWGASLQHGIAPALRVKSSIPATSLARNGVSRREFVGVGTTRVP